MNQKTYSKLGLIALIVAAILAVMVVRDASATNRDDPDVDVDQRQEQEQDQSQDQSQGQDQSQTTNQDQANSQSLTLNGSNELKTTGRAYTSSGDATADCQKFGGISSGWLGGAFGLGINWTDKECRQLKVYDRLVDRGLIVVANKALCGTKTLRKLYGRDGAGTCQAELRTAYDASQGASESEIDELRRMVLELAESSRQAAPDSPENGIGNTEYDRQDGEAAFVGSVTDAETCPDCPDCSVEATRAFEQCVSK